MGMGTFGGTCQHIVTYLRIIAFARRGRQCLPSARMDAFTVTRDGMTMRPVAKLICILDVTISIAVVAAAAVVQCTFRAADAGLVTLVVTLCVMVYEVVAS